MELNPYRAWQEYKARRLEKVTRVLVKYALEIDLEQLPCSYEQLLQGLKNINGRLLESSSLETPPETNWFNRSRLIDHAANKSYQVSTRLRMLAQVEGGNMNTLMSQSRVVDLDSMKETVQDRYLYAWSHQGNGYDHVLIVNLQDKDWSGLSAEDEKYKEAVGIIVNAHERIFGVDPRLLPED